MSTPNGWMSSMFQFVGKGKKRKQNILKINPKNNNKNKILSYRVVITRRGVIDWQWKVGR